MFSVLINRRNDDDDDDDESGDDNNDDDRDGYDINNPQKLETEILRKVNNEIICFERSFSSCILVYKTFTDSTYYIFR